MSKYIYPIFHITDEEPSIFPPIEKIKKNIDLSNSEDYYLKITGTSDVNFTEYDDIEENLKKYYFIFQP